MRRAVVLGALVAGCGRFDFDRIDADADARAATVAPVALTIATASTASASFVPIDGATLELTAVPGFSWILVASAALESTSHATDTAAEIDYLVDGVRAGIGGTQQAADGKPGPWQSFVVIGEQAATVQFEARDAAGGTTTIHDLRAVAFLLPTTGFTYVAQDADTLVESTGYQPAVVFPLGTATGDHVILALANSSETAESTDILLQWLDTSGTAHLTDVQNPRLVIQSNLAIWRETITASAPTITLEGHAVVAPSVITDARLLAIPTAVLASLDFAFAEADRSNTSATPLEIQALEVAPSAADAFVYLTTTRIAEDCDTVAGERRIHFLLDDQPVAAIDHLSDNCAEKSSYGTVGLAPAPPFTLSTTIATAGSTQVFAREAATVVLGLRLPRK